MGVLNIDITKPGAQQRVAISIYGHGSGNTSGPGGDFFFDRLGQFFAQGNIADGKPSTWLQIF